MAVMTNISELSLITFGCSTYATGSPPMTYGNYQSHSNMYTYCSRKDAIEMIYVLKDKAIMFDDTVKENVSLFS